MSRVIALLYAGWCLILLLALFSTLDAAQLCLPACCYCCSADCRSLCVVGLAVVCGTLQCNTEVKWLQPALAPLRYYRAADYHTRTID